MRPRLPTGLPLSQRFSEISVHHVSTYMRARALSDTPTYSSFLVESKAYSPECLEGVFLGYKFLRRFASTYAPSVIASAVERRVGNFLVVGLVGRSGG